MTIANANDWSNKLLQRFHWADTASSTSEKTIYSLFTLFASKPISKYGMF